MKLLCFSFGTCMPYFSSYLQQPQFFHTNASGHSRKSIRNRNRHSHAAITKNCCSILMPCIAFTSLWTEISKACMPLSLSRKCETLFQIMCQDEEVATGEAQCAEASLGTRKRYQKQDLPPKPRNHQGNSSPRPAAHSSFLASCLCLCFGRHHLQERQNKVAYHKP